MKLYLKSVNDRLETLNITSFAQKFEKIKYEVHQKSTTINAFEQKVTTQVEFVLEVSLFQLRQFKLSQVYIYHNFGSSV